MLLDLLLEQRKAQVLLKDEDQCYHITYHKDVQDCKEQYS